MSTVTLDLVPPPLMTLDPTRATLAEALEATMRERGLTQAATADELGVSQQTVNHWVLDDAAPSPGAFEAICRFLGIREEELAQIYFNSAKRKFDRRSRRPRP